MVGGLGGGIVGGVVGERAVRKAYDGVEELIWGPR
jgi:hypothetical protein